MKKKLALIGRDRVVVKRIAESLFSRRNDVEFGQIKETSRGNSFEMRFENYIVLVTVELDRVEA